MARSSDPRCYPRDYWDIVEWLQANPYKVLVIGFREKGQANSFRLNFNSFKQAALREGWDQKLGLTGLVSLLVRVRLADTGLYEVCIGDRDQAPDARAIRQALSAARREEPKEEPDVEECGLGQMVMDIEHKDRPAYVDRGTPEQQEAEYKRVNRHTIRQEKLKGEKQ